MPAQITIPARFNGPPTSGNGGYSCGVLAAHIRGPARIRLHVPPPLDTALAITGTATGGVELHHGDTLVGTGEPASLDLQIPEPPSIGAALTAMQGYPCYRNHVFPTCFVCGPERALHDGLELFPGPLSGRDGVWACLWQPAADLLDECGLIRAEIVWAALDCPGYFAALGDRLRPALLGELLGELYMPVAGDQPLIVFSWPLAEEGRKFYAGTAIATGAGEIVASARSIWVALRH
ncbi:MAG: hypothetical protein R3E64_00355 [Halioglobus sp.]